MLPNTFKYIKYNLVLKFLFLDSFKPLNSRPEISNVTPPQIKNKMKY